eukprot:scaffold1205_cov249-Pinguiococcus_pyrenoidosus.AAC.11
MDPQGTGRRHDSVNQPEDGRDGATMASGPAEEKETGTETSESIARKRQAHVRHDSVREHEEEYMNPV